MFPLSRLTELSPRTRQRKIARILQGIEVQLAAGGASDASYLVGLLEHLSTGTGPEVREASDALARELGAGTPIGVLRKLNALRHALLTAIEAEPADWDLLDLSTGRLDRSGLRTFPMSVYLEDIRSPYNVGSIFRTAEAFGAQRVLLSARTPSPDHPRALKTSRGAHHVLPWGRAELSGTSGYGGVFALELGGSEIERFAFPAAGIVLVGSEELGLSPEALRLADDGLGRVSIPLEGAKRTLNVAVAFGILMHAWCRFLSSGRP